MSELKACQICGKELGEFELHNHLHCAEYLLSRAEKAEHLLGMTQDSLESYADFYSKAASLSELPKDCLHSEDSDLHILTRLAEWDYIKEQRERAEKAEAKVKEWQTVAEMLADELNECNSERRPISWEDASESSPAWIAYVNLRDRR